MNQNQIHQVFISSTFKDLQEERAEVTQALLELDCLPTGMEAFPAANSTQWEWIKKVILQCDYYVVIVGGKYGTVNEETGLSYTEMEYDFATDNDIPTIAFLIKEPDKLIADKTEKDPIKSEKLEKFRDKVQGKLCRYYTSVDHLGGLVSRSISTLKKTDPRPGWVRADSLESNVSNTEVIDLLKENKNLKEKINILSEVKIQDQNALLKKEHEIECKIYDHNSGEVTVDHVKLQWKDIVKFALLTIDKAGSTYKELGTITGIIENNDRKSYTLTSASDNMIKAKLLIEGYIKYITTRNIMLTRKGKEFLAELL